MPPQRLLQMRGFSRSPPTSAGFLTITSAGFQRSFSLVFTLSVTASSRTNLPEATTRSTWIPARCGTRTLRSSTAPSSKITGGVYTIVTRHHRMCARARTSCPLTHGVDPEPRVVRCFDRALAPPRRRPLDNPHGGHSWSPPGAKRAPRPLEMTLSNEVPKGRPRRSSPVTTPVPRIRNRWRNAGWSPRRDSNPRPLPYQGSGATRRIAVDLTTEGCLPSSPLNFETAKSACPALHGGLSQFRVSA